MLATVEARRPAKLVFSDEHVVDRGGQLVEEPLDLRCVVGVEGGAAVRLDVAGGSLEPLRVAPGEDDVGALASGEPCRVQPEAGAAADHDDGLAEQSRLTLDGDAGGFGGHGRSSFAHSHAHCEPYSQV